MLSKHDATCRTPVQKVWEFGIYYWGSSTWIVVKKVGNLIMLSPKLRQLLLVIACIFNRKDIFSCRNTMLYWQHNETWAAPKQSQITYERHISYIREEPNGVFFHSTACLENKTQSLKVLPQWQVIFALFFWSFFSDSVLKSIVNRVFRVIWCLVLFV